MVCQVLAAILAVQDYPVQLEQLDFRVYLATQAVLATLVFQEFPGLEVVPDFVVRPVLRALLEQPVKYCYMTNIIVIVTDHFVVRLMQSDCRGLCVCVFSDDNFRTK